MYMYIARHIPHTIKALERTNLLTMCLIKHQPLSAIKPDQKKKEKPNMAQFDF